MLGRYSNAFAADDIAPSVRGLTLRLLPGDARAGTARPLDGTPALDESLLDLPLNTGRCFYAGSADIFRRSPLPPPLADLLQPRRARAGATAAGATAATGTATAAVTERLVAPRTVCVIGAGPSGLTAARELEKAGHTAIVLEAGDQVGGKCSSVQIDGRAYDLGDHLYTLLSSTPQLLGHTGSFTVTGGFDSLWKRAAGRRRSTPSGAGGSCRTSAATASGPACSTGWNSCRVCCTPTTSAAWRRSSWSSATSPSPRI